MKKEVLFSMTLAKTKTLTEKNFKHFEEYKDYLFKHYDALKANILLEEIINHQNLLDSKNKKQVIKDIQRKISLKERVEEEKKKALEKHNASMLISIMTAYLAIYFVKELLLNHYLIHLYVDSLIAVFAFYTALHQLKLQYDLHKLFGIKKNSFTLYILTLIIALILIIVTFQSKFDFTFFIIVIGALASKKVFERNIQS